MAHEKVHKKGTVINSSSMYLDLNKQGKGSLSAAKNVDSKLVQNKVERLLAFEEGMNRSINKASESTLFSAGEINADGVVFKVLRTQLLPYIQDSFYEATCIPYITVYKVDIIAGKYTPTEIIKFSNCYIEKWWVSVHGDLAQEGDETDAALEAIYFTIRFEERDDTIMYHDQEGKALGQKVTKINFKTGQLTA